MSKDKVGTTSLVFGIVSFVVPILASLVAIVTGIGSLIKARGRDVKRGRAYAGITLGLLTGASALAVLALVVAPLLITAQNNRKVVNDVEAGVQSGRGGDGARLNESIDVNPETLDRVKKAGIDINTVKCPGKPNVSVNSVSAWCTATTLEGNTIPVALNCSTDPVALARMEFECVATGNGASVPAKVIIKDGLISIS